MRQMTVRAGDILYRQGEPSETAYLILTGEAETVRGGVPVISAKGALLGFSALFQRPYGSTCRIVSDATLLVFTRRELRALIRSNPEQALSIVEAMIDMLGHVADAFEARSKP